MTNFKCEKHKYHYRCFIRGECVWCLWEEREKLLAERNDFVSKLAAISTACLSNTRETANNRLPKTHQFYTAAYSDACAAVDREIQHRERLENIAAALRVLKGVSDL